MSGFLATLIFSFALTRLPFAAVESQAQNLANMNSSQTGVVVVKLVAPMYPPVARAARIVGDVRLFEVNYAKDAVGVFVRAAGEEELVMSAVHVAGAILAELQRPHIVDFDGVATGIKERTKEFSRVGIKRINAAAGDVVAD